METYEHMDPVPVDRLRPKAGLYNPLYGLNSQGGAEIIDRLFSKPGLFNRSRTKPRDAAIKEFANSVLGRVTGSSYQEIMAGVTGDDQFRKDFALLLNGGKKASSGQERQKRCFDIINRDAIGKSTSHVVIVEMTFKGRLKILRL